MSGKKNAGPHVAEGAEPEVAGADLMQRIEALSVAILTVQALLDSCGDDDGWDLEKMARLLELWKEEAAGIQADVPGGAARPTHVGGL